MADPVVVEQSRAIRVAPETAFARTLPMPLPTLFRRWYGPIPPIKAVRDQAGEWSTAGQTRTIALTGGGTMRETLTEVRVPDSFAYSIDGITGPMGALIGTVGGEWLFAQHPAGTLVTWRWTIRRRSALTAPALLVFARIWRGYASQALASLEDYLSV